MELRRSHGKWVTTTKTRQQQMSWWIRTEYVLVPKLKLSERLLRLPAQVLLPRVESQRVTWFIRFYIRCNSEKPIVRDNDIGLPTIAQQLTG